MNDQQQYAACTRYDELSDQQRVRYAAQAAEDDRIAGDRTKAPAERARAQHRAQEARQWLALDARARGAEQSIGARTLEDAPCGCRSRPATATERAALATHVAQEFTPVRRHGEAAAPAVVVVAANAGPQEYAPLPPPYWQAATPSPSRATMAANARSSVPPAVAALTAIAGESYADRWARMYEACHPGEGAFVA